MTTDGEPKPIDLSADRPSVDPEADRLGYAPFAKRLADSILRLSGAEGHVLHCTDLGDLGRRLCSIMSATT